MPKLILDKQEYDVPSVSELTLDEAILFERYGGLTLAEFETRNADTMPIGVLKALAIVAVMRARRDVSEHEAGVAIGRIPVLQLREAFPQVEEEKKQVPLDERNESEEDVSQSPSGETSSAIGEASEGSDEPQTSGDPPSEALPFGLKTSAV